MWSTPRIGTAVLNVIMLAIHDSVEMSCSVWNQAKALWENKEFVKRAQNHPNKFSPRDSIPDVQASYKDQSYNLHYNSTSSSIFHIVTVAIIFLIALKK